MVVLIYYIKYVVSRLLSQNPSCFHLEKYHPIISSDIQDENLEHDEMSATRHAIVGIENRRCIGYSLVLYRYNVYYNNVSEIFFLVLF